MFYGTVLIVIEVTGRVYQQPRDQPQGLLPARPRSVLRITVARAVVGFDASFGRQGAHLWPPQHTCSVGGPDCRICPRVIFCSFGMR